MTNNSTDSTNAKICIICGQDCSTAPRFKNDEGQYLHEACYSADQQPVEAPATPAPPAAPPSLRTQATSSSTPRPRPAVPSLSSPRSRGSGGQSMTELLFSFDGRVGRMQYWMGILAINVLNLGFVIAATAMESMLVSILSLVLLWPALAFNIKRWHDRDKSGWWMLIVLIPIIGWIWIFVEQGLLRGTVGRNQYGDDPVG